MTRHSIVLFALAILGGCKKEESCNPGQVQWGVQLLVDATPSINLDANGDALPTVVRLYQVRGEIVIDNLDFATIWESEDVKALGEEFLAVEELTIYPGRDDQRLLPIESDATHVIATGWFREPLGNTWFGAYEIPLRHPDVVCKKAPESKIYPNPCFYVLLDRSTIMAGATPPAGFESTGNEKCAPLGVVVEESGGKKKKKKKKKKKNGLQDSLKDEGKDRLDGTRPQVPDKPPSEVPTDVPSRPPIDAPTAPQVPDKPPSSVPIGDPR
jgi:type VI secretion system protein VasD